MPFPLRASLLATYALCGFANFASIGIGGSGTGGGTGTGGTGGGPGTAGERPVTARGAFPPHPRSRRGDAFGNGYHRNRAEPPRTPEGHPAAWIAVSATPAKPSKLSSAAVVRSKATTGSGCSTGGG